jgi:excinuclease ABC subunit C
MPDPETPSKPPTSLERGCALIRDYTRMLPDTPGVYRMLNDKGDVLYVGKAKALRKRVLSYTMPGRMIIRIQRMVSQTVGMEFIHTHTEVEALLLEANLIKKFRPHYNILLKDDKSYPYILLTSNHDFPTVLKHRGAKEVRGDYFGPFASNWAVNRTIHILQRAFLLRNCTDSYFAQRKRPCLQYHIKRCTAPCVEYVTKEQYAEQVKEAKAFLSGESTAIQARLATAMNAASDTQNYELAAKYRDRIRALTAIQAHQDVSVTITGDVDVIGVFQREGRSCVQVFFFRGGQNFGNRAFFPAHDQGADPVEILSSFVMQFYDGKEAPPEILVSHALPESKLMGTALSAREYQIRKVVVTHPQRGLRQRLIEFATRNAEDALQRHLTERKGDAMLLEGVAKLFGLDEPPQRIEVYDNSHISGTNMVGAMIVAGPEGFRKNAYRKFNIRQADKSDDYGMMREVISRRFGKAVGEGVDRAGDDWPDLLLIDGGLGQLNTVAQVLAELGITDDLAFVGIAKGEDRNAGREKFFMPGKDMFQLPIDDPVLHYLQRLRDEAHRFAIGAHRTRRAMQIGQSLLDDVPGIGAKRKKALLQYFGSVKSVQDAGLQDLEKVDGISKEVARKIYAHFHESR